MGNRISTLEVDEHAIIRGKSQTDKTDKISLILVFGLGYSESDIRHDVISFQQSFREKTVIFDDQNRRLSDVFDIHILKPVQLPKILVNATKRVINRNKEACPRLKHGDKAVDKLVAKLRADVSLYKAVIVLGHSYGGYIVSRAAEQVANEITNKTVLDKILMATTGSLYIPPRSKLSKGVHLKHYLFEKDFINDCNGFNINSQLRKDDDYIKVIDLERSYPEHKSFVFTSLKAHTLYPQDRIAQELAFQALGKPVDILFYKKK